MRPNVEGNRRADEMLAEDQSVCRRVRLTARLGRECCRRQVATALGTHSERACAEEEMFDISGARASGTEATKSHDARAMSTTTDWRILALQLPHWDLRFKKYAAKKPRMTRTPLRMLMTSVGGLVLLTFPILAEDAMTMPIANA